MNHSIKTPAPHRLLAEARQNRNHCLQELYRRHPGHTAAQLKNLQVLSVSLRTLALPPAELMEAVGIQDGELVHIWSVTGTSRITTYAFAGPKGTIGINGGAAHFFKSGEKVIIAAFDLSDEPIIPRVLLLDKNNAIERDMTPFSVIG